ncbi:hypothetical protein Hdeb2414_s0012g00391241 [Helianthus debilis subsp. tardiflorus]
MRWSNLVVVNITKTVTILMSLIVMNPLHLPRSGFDFVYGVSVLVAGNGIRN